MGQAAADEVFERFDQRCRALGAWAWWCAPDGSVIAGGQTVAPAWVARVARAGAGGDVGEREVGPGVSAMALTRRLGARVLGVAVAAYPSGSPQLGQSLRWMFEDLSASARDASTLGEFSETLAQAYEETSLLFRLTRLMNSSCPPGQLMAQVCEQLQQVLPFGWVAMRFRTDGVEVGELAGRTFMAGRAPLDGATFERLSREVLEGGGGAWARLLEPGRSGLASGVGTEVIAEPIAHDRTVIGALLAGNKVNGDPDATSGEMQFLASTADVLGMFHENVARFAEQRATFMGMMRALVAAIDAKDPYTCGHSERVALLASQTAAAIGLDETVVEQYRVAGLLHDVGKIGVPEAVLCKAGKLDEAEFAQVKRHPEIGYHILKDIPLLGPMLPGVLHHHERWDGSGYPHRLGGEAIPMVARVLALADTFDAMSSERSYRSAMSRQVVLAEVGRCAGSQFDPGLAGVFAGLDFGEFDRLLAGAARRSRAA